MKRVGLGLLVAAVVAGLCSGPLALASAVASQPPLEWRDLVGIAAAGLIGLPAVLGFQALLGNLNAMRLGWWLFFYGAVYSLAAGLAAVFVAWRGAELGPPSFMVLAVGLGLLGGLGLLRVALRRKFARA